MEAEGLQQFECCCFIFSVPDDALDFIFTDLPDDRQGGVEKYNLSVIIEFQLGIIEPDGSFRFTVKMRFAA